MLGVKILDTNRARASWQAVQRRVSFAQRDGMFFGIGNVRKKFAEAPDAALVERIVRGAAVEPERLQCCRISGGTGASPVQVGSPSGKKEFQQLAACGATKVLDGRRRSSAAG